MAVGADSGPGAPADARRSRPGRPPSAAQTRAAKADPRVRITGMRVWPSRLCKSVCTRCGSEMEYEEAVLQQGASGPFVWCPHCLAEAPLSELPREQSAVMLQVDSEEARRDLLLAVTEQVERTQARLQGPSSLAEHERHVHEARLARLTRLLQRLCEL